MAPRTSTSSSGVWVVPGFNFHHTLSFTPPPLCAPSRPPAGPGNRPGARVHGAVVPAGGGEGALLPGGAPAGAREGRGRGSGGKASARRPLGRRGEPLHGGCPPMLLLWSSCARSCMHATTAHLPTSSCTPLRSLRHGTAGHLPAYLVPAVGPDKRPPPPTPPTHSPTHTRAPSPPGTGRPAQGAHGG